jgi:type I restriction enzyme S subunit
MRRYDFMENVSSSYSQKANVPKLRFPEFDGEWVVEKLSDFTERITRKNTENQTSLPLTISSKDGLVDQISYFNKTVASKDMSGYYLLLNGEFAYNKSYSVGYDFGSIKRLDKYPMGALSTLYICFALKKYNSDYIKVYFDSLKWYKEIYMIAAEGARNHGLLNVPTDLFFETKHFIPKNEKEQKKIAEFFMLLNSRIEKQQQLVENLKTYKRGVVKASFDKKYDITTTAWKTVKIGEIFDVTRGYVLSASELREDADNEYYYPVYSSQTKNNGLMGYYNEFLYENAITWTTDGANAGFVKYRKGKFYCTNVCGVLLSSKIKANNYIAEKLNSISKYHVSYVGNPKLMNNVMSEISIAIPGEEEQQYFSDLFELIDNKITVTENILKRLNDLKSFFLQQMFI